MAKGKFDVASRVSSRPAPTASPDDVLFKASKPTPAAETVDSTDAPVLVRFGSQLPADELVLLHRISYERRIPLYEALTEAITLLSQAHPDAARKSLPEKERERRKLPHA